MRRDYEPVRVSQWRGCDLRSSNEADTNALISGFLKSLLNPVGIAVTTTDDPIPPAADTAAARRLPAFVHRRQHDWML